MSCQKYLKRLRKNTGLKIKYVCTEEFGTRRGRIHYHLLVFGPFELKKRMLKDDWKLGFSDAKLLYCSVNKPDNRSAINGIRYVTKYLLKQTGRVRSSGKLGVSKK